MMYRVIIVVSLRRSVLIRRRVGNSSIMVQYQSIDRTVSDELSDSQIVIIIRLEVQVLSRFSHIMKY